MRLKIVIGVLLAASGVLVLSALLSKGLRPGTEVPAPPDNTSFARPEGASAGAPAELPADPAMPATTPPPAAQATDAAAPAAPDPAHARYIERRIAELDDMAMKNDAVSRDTILSELRNPDGQIREAALEAVVQFSDRSVVPRLQEIAEQTEDPAEKAAILEAIEYINLPSLTEVLAQKRAEREAMGITNPPAPSTNRIHRGARPPRRLAPPASL
jgi:hypothetical protein